MTLIHALPSNSGVLHLVRKSVPWLAATPHPGLPSSSPNLQGISPGTRTQNQNVPCVSGDLIHGPPFSIANQEEISGQLSSACCPRVMTSSLPLFSSLPPPPYHYRKSLCLGDKKTWSGSYCAPGSPLVTSQTTGGSMFPIENENNNLYLLHFLVFCGN